MTRKILSIDYGQKRTGLAISDPSQIIASPLERIMTGKNHKETAMAIKALLESKRYTIEKIILGDPKLLGGEKSSLSVIIEAFAKELESLMDCPVILFDERLTSKEGEKLMIEAKVKRKKRTAHIDTMSACLILQTYLSIPKPL